MGSEMCIRDRCSLAVFILDKGLASLPLGLPGAGQDERDALLGWQVDDKACAALFAGLRFDGAQMGADDLFDNRQAET